MVLRDGELGEATTNAAQSLGNEWRPGLLLAAARAEAAAAVTNNGSGLMPTLQGR